MEFKKTTRPRPKTKPPAPVLEESVVVSDGARVKDILSLINVKRSVAFVSIVAGVIIALIIVVSFSPAPRTNKNQEKQVSAPDYVTVVPKGETVSTLGGWKRISPPDRDPVFAYSDTIDGVNISVSQQPLPQSFKGNVDGSIAELAKGYNATNKLDANGTTAYIGTSAKGPQSVILTRDGLLILIKSEKNIKDSSWERYIAQLEIETPVKY